MKMLLATVAWVTLLSAASAAEIRYEDVIYLDEAHAKPLPLKTTQRVALTVSRDQSTILAWLPKDHVVWVLGLCEGRHYVETDINSGRAKGWVDIAAIETLSEEIRNGIEKRVLQKRHRRELIAKHEIETGMSRAEVQAALGKPTETTRTQEGDNVEEQWVFRTYKNVPQRDYYSVDGKLYERVYYKKVQAGGKTVTFRNDEVAAIKDEDKQPEAASPTVVLPPPVIYWY